MGIKDEGKDKQELKNLVEGSVEKKLKEFSKETEKNRANDKKEILKELKTREEKGLNTLAQKFELLKLKAEQSNKQQSKNPLVELSDKNLKWLSEHAIANQKPENMGKGLAKNVISSIKNTEKSEGVPAPLGTLPMPPQEEETATKSILKSKMTLEEKVDEIHKIVTKGIPKEQKESSNILAKGFQGLTKGMKNTQKILKEIGDETKKWAGILTMGALGTLAVVGWFKEGGPKKLADAIKNGILPALADLSKSIIKGVVNALKDATDDAADAIEEVPQSRLDSIASNDVGAGSLNTDDVVKKLDTNYSGSKTKYGQTQFADDGSYWSGTKIKKMKDAGAIQDAATNRLLEDPKHNWGNFNANVKKYLNTKDGKKLAFPVATKFLDAEFNEDGTASVLIEKSQITKNGAAAGVLKQAAQYATGEMPRLVITGVIKILVPKGKVIPKNTFMFVVGKSYQLIGDVSAFMDGEDFEKYENSETLETVGNDNYKKFINEKGNAEAYAKTMNDFGGKERLKIGATETVKQGVNALNDKVNETMGKENPKGQQEVPKADVTQVSENKQKLNEQTQELQTPPKPPVADGTQVQGGGQNTQQQPQRTTMVPSSTPTDSKRPEQFKSLDNVLPGRTTIGP